MQVIVLILFALYIFFFIFSCFLMMIIQKWRTSFSSQIVFLFSMVPLRSSVRLPVTFASFVYLFFLRDVRYLSYGYIFEATEQVNVFGGYVCFVFLEKNTER